MKYRLRKDVEVDFSNQRRIAERMGIHEVTLSNILNRRVATTKPIAVYIVILNGNFEKDLELFFEKETKRGK